MPLNPFQRGSDPYMLIVGMTGVKLGEQVAQLGCAHGGRLAAVAKRVGLTGRALAVVPDEASASRARRGAADAGVLVDVEIAPPTQVPADAATFDLVIVDDTGGLLSGRARDDCAAAVREIMRILRPGGRVLVVGAAARGALRRLWGSRNPPSVDPEPWLQADGFKSVRKLAERDGLAFVEGLKPRTS